MGRLFTREALIDAVQLAASLAIVLGLGWVMLGKPPSLATIIVTGVVLFVVWLGRFGRE